MEGWAMIRKGGELHKRNDWCRVPGFRCQAIKDGRYPDTWHPTPGTCRYGFLVVSGAGRFVLALVESCAIAPVFFR